MTDSPQSIDRELIRYRIKKRMAGRRDLLLHFMVYVAIAIIVWMNTPWFAWEDYLVSGALWTIPLILHGLRYYYRCGPGTIARADEIERAIEDVSSQTALDRDEESLIEERVVKRITARGIVVAHGMVLAMLLTIRWLDEIRFQGFINPATNNITIIFAGIFALHVVRFFLVHGRTAEGRALKIESEVERRWLELRDGRSARKDAVETGEDDLPLLELGELSGRQLRLSAEGEFENGDEFAGGVARQLRARRP